MFALYGFSDQNQKSYQKKILEALFLLSRDLQRAQKNSEELLSLSASSSHVDQKPRFLFTYQSSYSKFPFDYLMNQHPVFPAFSCLQFLGEGKHTFSFNTAKEFQDLPVSLLSRVLTSQARPCPETTISTTPGPKLALSQADSGTCLHWYLSVLYLSDKLAHRAAAFVSLDS